MRHSRLVECHVTNETFGVDVGIYVIGSANDVTDLYGKFFTAFKDLNDWIQLIYFLKRHLFFNLLTLLDIYKDVHVKKNVTNAVLLIQIKRKLNEFTGPLEFYYGVECILP